MTNNFDIIKPLLEFPQDDSFYFLQILQRKKDHVGERIGGSNNNSRLIKAYYIKSVERLEIYRDEIIKLCDVFGARASINLNPRSFEKTAYHLLIKIAHQMHNKAFSDISKAYDSVCGVYQAEMDKRWIVDVDAKDIGKGPEIESYIEELQATITNKPYKVLALIPSRTGKHIITNPFNLQKFSEKYPDIEVHKNNPTNLYIP